MIQTIDFPELAFEPVQHVYVHRPTMRRLDSVTQVMGLLGLALEWWSPAALARGRWVHECAHLFVLGDLDEGGARSQHPEWWGWVEAFIRAMSALRVEPRFSEVRLYDERWGLAGTADLPGIFYRGEREGWEIKTGDTSHVEIQCGGYDAMWKVRVPGLPIARWRCLELRRDGGFHLSDPLDVTGGWYDLAACLRVLAARRRYARGYADKEAA
jgi:hypothetical protein